MSFMCFQGQEGKAGSVKAHKRGDMFNARGKLPFIRERVGAAGGRGTGKQDRSENSATSGAS